MSSNQPRYPPKQQSSPKSRACPKLQSSPKPHACPNPPSSLKSRHRSGQVTVYIIVSVFLVVLLGLLYMRVERTEKRVSEFTKTTQQWDVSTIQGFVQSCVNKVSADSIFYLGMVGGRTGYFSDFVEYDEYYRIPYYFSHRAPKKNLMPSKAQVEQDILGTYIAARVKGCTNGFREVAGFSIKEGDVKPKVSINEKSVDVKVEYPLEITKEGQTTVLKDFSFSQPSRLFEILRIANAIIEKEMKDDRIIYWDYLSGVTRQGFNITAHAEHVHTVVYRIVDPQSPLFFEPYVFQFANRVRVEG